jgi:hypothetical protein
MVMAVFLPVSPLGLARQCDAGSPVVQMAARHAEKQHLQFIDKL